MYKFVNTNSDSGGDVDPVAKSLNVQTQALNNMGRTINGIASTVVALKNIALHRLNEDIKASKQKFKPKYTKQKGNPFKSLMLNIKAYKVKGFLESMLSFFGSLLKIFIIRPILNWLSDPANKKKLEKILETTWKVLKGITDFLGSQVVHAFNELHDVLSGKTSVWKKITSFTKLWIKFAAGFLAIKFLANPVKLLRSVANVGKMLAIKTKLAKAQLTKRKKFLTGGKWGKGAWLLGGAVGAYSLFQFAQWALGKKENEDSGDDSSPNASGGNRGTDRAFSIEQFGEDLTTAMYDTDIAKALGIKKKEEKKENKWNPKNWFKGGEKESKKDGDSPNALGVIAGMYTANEQMKGLIKTFKGESKEFGDRMNDADGAGKANLLLKLAGTLESALGSKNQMFQKLQMSTQNLVESAENVANGDKTSIGDFLKWAGHDIPSREGGGPIGSYANGGQMGRWMNGSHGGYLEEHNGQPLVAHGLEGMFTKSGSNDGFIVPFDNAATRRNPMLTMMRLAQAKQLGFNNGPPGFESGGLGLSGISSILKGGGQRAFGHPQAYQEPQSGGLGILQRLVASHRGDELTSALLARTVMNRKAVIDKTGNAMQFGANSGSLTDILNAPGQYPNVGNGAVKRKFSNNELNMAGKAMKLAKESSRLKERIQETGVDPAKASQLNRSTIFKSASGIGKKGGLAALLTGGGAVKFGNYQFSNKQSNHMAGLLGGMNPAMIKGLMSVVGNITSGKDDNIGTSLIRLLTEGGLGGKGKGEKGGLMDSLFGIFGMPTKKGSSAKQGGSMSGGLGQVLQGIFGGKGAKDKKEERMEFKKRQNERHRQIMKYEASQQKRNIMSRLHDQSSQNAREITSAVNSSNKAAASQARMGAEAVARLSQQSQQQQGASFMGIFKSLASKLSSSKSK